jgi:hypothetical protein
MWPLRWGHGRGDDVRGAAGDVARAAASALLRLHRSGPDDAPIGHAADLITTTRLVYAVRVRGQLSPVDGAIELTDIVLDLHGPDLDDIDAPDV